MCLIYRTLGRGDRDDGTNLQLNIEQPEGTYQQLSLFPSFEEQVGTIAAAEASIQYTMPAAFSLPQEQIDSILRSGGGRDNSRKRIYAKYQQGKTPEEMAEFLKNEYKTTGKGFEFDGNPVSLWFDEMGMRIGYGTSAKENTLAVMSWSEVESHIRVMVEKLSNVEHQLETAKVEVTKPFAQEQELAEKLERLAELNALLNMDEKGDNALDMGDDEPEDENGEQSAQTQESEPNRAEDIQAVAEEPLKPVASFLMSERIAEHDKERMLADGSRGRVSVKEKLAEMKQKISDQKMPEKPETVKSKGKEESL